MSPFLPSFGREPRGLHPRPPLPGDEWHLRLLHAPAVAHRPAHPREAVGAVHTAAWHTAIMSQAFVSLRPQAFHGILTSPIVFVEGASPESWTRLLICQAGDEKYILEARHLGENKHNRHGLRSALYSWLTVKSFVLEFHFTIACFFSVCQLLTFLLWLVLSPPFDHSVPVEPRLCGKVHKLTKNHGN